MATIAVAPEGPSVDVVFPMTALTGFPRTEPVLDRLPVTGEAVKTFMCSVEAELGPGVVIKLPEAPAVRIVTVGTFIAEALLMRIRLLVAGKALVPCLLECRTDMAPLAGSHRVHPDQWEVGQVVVKLDVGLPAALIVTLVAGLTQLAAVGIVVFVTTVAIQGQLLPGGRSGVAFIAKDVGMLVAQGELGLVVVEFRLLPSVDVMAAFTFVAVAAAVQVVGAVTGYAIRFKVLVVERLRVA